ncbi:MAG: hypothetical protein E7553_06690 [Ruminococcaceae bacterium]|nr:hypothetical protein [Oscillospiraceae bacterium]
MSKTINSLEFRTTMTDQLEKALVQGSTVGVFEDNALRTKFVGAKTVLIPTMDMSSLGDYDRNNGFVAGSIAVQSEPFTLEQDRARSFQLDREDNDETGIAELAGEVLSEFVRTKVVPEVDAYTLSKLGGYAAANGQTVEGDPDTEAYAMFGEAVSAIREVVGFDEELICFADNAFLKSLSASPEISRQIVMSDFKKGDVHTRVRTLDDIKLLPVPLSRMKTQYDFFDGTTEGQEEGGFVPTDAAKSIGFLVLPKRAVSLVKKSETLRTFSPEQNLKADAWKFDYRLYYDAFIKTTMRGAVYAFIRG